MLASGRKPEKIIRDQGMEFFNKHFKALLKDEGIELYNETTYRGTFDRYAENNNVAILYYGKENHVIHRDVTRFSVSIHRSIKRKPAAVTADSEKQVWHTLYDDQNKVKHLKYKFNIGDL